MHAINHILISATQQLHAISETALLDAQVLLAHALHVNQAYLYTWPNKTVSEEQYQQFQSMLNRRLTSEPIAYIIGQKEFWSLPFIVNSSTLIPRSETELIVEFCVNTFTSDQALKLLDLGTGCGAIAIAIASMRPNWQIVATDISNDALTTAQKNAENLQINTVQFIQSHWFKQVPLAQFDIIISNPPYIAKDDSHLNSPELAYEPMQALVSDDQGMSDLSHIIRHAQRYLASNGYLILEHGYNQSDAVSQLMSANGYTHIINQADLSGIQRVTAGRNK